MLFQLRGAVGGIPILQTWLPQVENPEAKGLIVDLLEIIGAVPRSG